MEFSMYASLVCLFLTIPAIESKNVREFERIYDTITNGYRKQVLPVSEVSTPLNIYVQTYLMSVYEIDQTAETSSASMVVSLQWFDPRLVWNQSIYSNTTNLVITTDDIWLPYVYLINNADSFHPLGYESESYARVRSSGYVYWNPGGLMKAKCRANVSKFPFDVQTCEFQFGVWSLSKRDAILKIFSEASITSFYISNSDWDITAAKQLIRETDNESSFILQITASRRPLYNIIIIILPTILFALMNPLVFFLPVDSGERVSLGMTILLSYAIFLTLVASSVPVSSNPMCVFLVILVFIMIFSGVLVVAVIISVHYYYVEDLNNAKSCCRRLALYICKKRNGEKCLTGKDMSKTLDFIFIFISYATLASSMVGFFIYANI